MFVELPKNCINKTCLVAAACHSYSHSNDLSMPSVSLLCAYPERYRTILNRAILKSNLWLNPH